MFEYLVSIKVQVVNQAPCFESRAQRGGPGAESIDSYRGLKRKLKLQLRGHTHSQKSNGVNGELVILIVAHDCNRDVQLLSDGLNRLNEV